MKFKITSEWEIGSVNNVILLISDNWDDFGYKTMFHARYYDNQGMRHELGTVKIAIANKNHSFRTTDYIDKEFDFLKESFFSLWQTAEAYRRVMEWEKICQFDILRSLNDIAYNPDIYEKYKESNVLQKSLFRDVSYTLYTTQFRRITRGEAILTPYHFSYIIGSENTVINECALTFSVVPYSLPPTNVHAIIGSNGTGKTTLIKQMIQSICKKENIKGRFSYAESFYDEGMFENIICISFSPFDDYSKIENCCKELKYIGIRKEYDIEGYEDGYGEISLLDDIRKNYLISLKNCLYDATKKDDLREILDMLETECNFLTANYAFDLNIDKLSPDSMECAANNFDCLSAGHKVVLSIITRCIDELVEKSVIFIDEPENHLHPPLLSSLIRGISKMLIKRNGVAIISTHSPIVLQEIPKSSVWIINRIGTTCTARRPEIETFGTNIGVLTNEIFGYEVQRTGFNTLLQVAVDKYSDYDSVLEAFDHQLGDEAKSIVRIMLKQKEI